MLRWGCLYDLALEGATAEAVIVVSEDDWNLNTRDAVIVPVYRNRKPEGNVLIAVDDDLVADCTRVQNIANEDIGDLRGPVDSEAMLRTRIGLRVYLDVDRLTNRAGPRAPTSSRTSWWPAQGQVRYASVAQFVNDKMFGVVSDDDWNSLPTTTYSATVKLTSKTYPTRAPWEVEIAGGWVVAGHLFSTLHEDIDHATPASPRPNRLTVDELAEVADRLIQLLNLS